MQFLTSLFGGSGNTLVMAALALGIVLVLIVFGVWMLKVFFKASNTIGRGRNRRLSIVDHMQIDAKRQLLIVRRDNVEHLILTGGTQDVVVEAGIAVERPTMPQRRPLHEAESTDASAAGEFEAKKPVGPHPHIEKLRELARPAAQRKSLRHTGLMRPVSRMETAVLPMPPIPGDKSERAKSDSATSATAIETNGQAKLGAARYFGDGIKADNS